MPATTRNDRRCCSPQTRRSSAAVTSEELKTPAPVHAHDPAAGPARRRCRPAAADGAPHRERRAPPVRSAAQARSGPAPDPGGLYGAADLGVEVPSSWQSRVTRALGRRSECRFLEAPAPGHVTGLFTGPRVPARVPHSTRRRTRHGRAIIKASVRVPPAENPSANKFRFENFHGAGQLTRRINEHVATVLSTGRTGRPIR